MAGKLQRDRSAKHGEHEAPDAPETPADFERFEELARKLAKVPTVELDAKRRAPKGTSKT